ncbi:hypothetical protein [Leptolyngbya sp. FACHB-711]|jgi:hypothetical protein|uniref:hypothetical protein n=1 Tax=unclassified Leptolyngbya TaxID=2650499 RepID=UPI0016837BFE|nr:hypothetical protein [Leptolyngbya sp. FACHB-711]MBD1851886.1 hypothetical protein [Cyanobacteria bacterium FACHB-502]MBD2027244.1 hypothetical protein [Leptolyngbya sp. FACHB-711]
MYRFPTDVGIQFALRVWIVFILVFWLVRFRAELAILLGALAGVMAGILMTYWKAQKLPDAPPPAERPDHPLFRVSDRIAKRLRRSTEKNNLEQQSIRKPRRRRLGKAPNWKR